MRFVYSLLTILYVLSPYDIMPDVIVGLGWIDDIVLLLFLFRYLFKTKTISSFNNHATNFNPYSILGVEQSSSSEQIKAAYRKIANQYHPDKVIHLNNRSRKKAEMKFMRAKEAYEQLQNIGKV